uniref:B30.2/SPRY domain-containing protein n=1 Tax=Cyprinus carpio TaxID=7962 RepID=A0A8C1NNP2_CYPCA
HTQPTPSSNCCLLVGTTEHQPPEQPDTSTFFFSPCRIYSEQFNIHNYTSSVITDIFIHTNPKILPLVIIYTNTVQPYPDHPDRFDECRQVLFEESVCGRCYWEIEWSGCVCISVSYKSISRKGGGVDCVFGSNDQSWSLICTPSRYSFKHSNMQTHLPVKSISSRIGVFVDHGAGTLSFYSVSDTMSLIHTVQTTFTQPLYPGFYVWSGSSVKLC